MIPRIDVPQASSVSIAAPTYLCRASQPEAGPLGYYGSGCRHYVETAPMNLLQDQSATCPHCWETISLTLDLSVPEQSYIEDCPVCCKPIVVSYSAADGEVVDFSVESAE